MAEITSVLLPSQPVLSVLRRCHVDAIEEVIHAGVDELREAATGAGLTIEGDPFGIFHAPVTTESDGPLEIALPVNGLTHTSGDLRSYHLQGGRFAQRRLVGPETFWPTILSCYDEVSSWVDQSGHTRVGPPRETWHNSPRDAEPLELTVSWPYA